MEDYKLAQEKLQEIAEKDKLKSQTLENEVHKAATSQVKFARHMAVFSKFISFIFVITYLITFIVYLGISVYHYFVFGDFLMDIQTFVLSPTQTVLAFYFTTKGVENVSSIISGYLSNKLSINGISKEGE